MSLPPRLRAPVLTFVSCSKAGSEIWIPSDPDMVEEVLLVADAVIITELPTVTVRSGVIVMESDTGEVSARAAAGAVTAATAMAPMATRTAACLKKFITFLSLIHPVILNSRAGRLGNDYGRARGW